MVFSPTSAFWSILLDTLVPWSPWVTRYTGGLSQLLVVKMSWGKNSKKKHDSLTKFCFLVNFIRHTGPMVTMGHQVHRWDISASIPVVEMSWGGKFKTKPNILNIIFFWSISSETLVTIPRSTAQKFHRLGRLQITDKKYFLSMLRRAQKKKTKVGQNTRFFLRIFSELFSTTFSWDSPPVYLVPMVSRKIEKMKMKTFGINTNFGVC